MRNSTMEVLNRSEDHRKVFETYLSPSYKRQMFDTHDIEFTLRQGPGYEQGRAYNADLYISLAVSMNGKKGVYGAGSISKGMLANALALQEGPFTIDRTGLRAPHVYDMDEHVGTQLFHDKVLTHNVRVQIQKNGLFETVFKDHPVLIPSALQGAVSVAGLPEFDRGAKRRDKHFMQLWTPVIRELTDIFPVVGDWFFSGATSGLEYTEAECNAAGLRDRRPEADMWFRDWNNEDVPLSEIMRRRAEYLIWAAKHGFFLKHEATAFMRSAAIAEMGDREMLPRANPTFLKGISDNLDNIRYLQKEMEPLILEHIQKRLWLFDPTDLEFINARFVEKALEAQKGLRIAPQVSMPAIIDRLDSAGIDIHRYTLKELMAGDYEFKELRVKWRPEHYLDVTRDDVMTQPLSQVDMKGEAWKAHDGSSLFSRQLLPGINERESQQVRAMIGGLETLMPSSRRSIYVVADDRYGPETERAKREHNLSYGDEVPGVLGEDFDRQIRARHRRQVQLQPFLGKLAVVSSRLYFSTDIDDKVALYADLPEFSMAQGEARPGENAALLARHTVLARRVNDFCFVTGRWEESDRGAQDMILATRMQLGLEARSPIDPKFVRVFDEKGRYLTIADRAMAIWEKAEEAIRNGHDVHSLETQISAVTQLRAFHRLARDHAMRHHAFEDLRKQYPDIHLRDLQWERIPVFPFLYDHVAFDGYWEKRIRPVLEGPAAVAVSLRHMEFFEDFKEIRKRQIASQEIEAAGRPPDASIYVRSGFDLKP